MCGFCLSLNDAAFDIRHRTESIRHRGPDGTKYFEGLDVRCGVNRLAIVDQDARSDQPMVDSSGRYLLAFNGEIYNHHELRQRLAARHRVPFVTRSDTEVLLEGLIHEGPAFAAELDGIFAFAFVDLASREVTLARDVFGVKPLYYCSRGESLYVSSEVMPLWQTSGGRLCLSSMARYLSYGTAGSGDSIVAGVNELEPNSVKIFRPGHAAATTRIHEFAYDVRDDAGIEEIRDALNRTIEDQKPGIPYGVLFSGGLDSTLILDRCAEDGLLSGAYSVDVDHPDMSEGRWQEYVVAALNLQEKHRQVALHREDLSVESIARISEGLDSPLFHPNFIGSFLLTRMASEDGLKVLFSGEGADELFLGYRWLFSEPAPSEFLEYVPLHDVRALLRADVPPIATSGMSQAEIFQKIYLRRWLLRQDLTGMAHSVEVRVPFLGLALARLMNGLSMEFKKGSGESKWIIKKLLSRRFSREFVERKKVGFDVPLNDWIGDEHVDFLRGQSDLIETVALDAVLRKHSGSSMRNRLIFSLVSLALWHQSVKSRGVETCTLQ